MHLKKETLSNDTIEQADMLNDLSHLKMLQYSNLKSDLPTLHKLCCHEYKINGLV